MHIEDQKRAIVNPLVGGPPDTFRPLCDFDEPWRTIYRRTTRVGSRTEAEILLFNTTDHIEDREERRACILDLCARWLYQYLTGAGEPVKPVDVVRAASDAGFPRRTLYRARQAHAGFVVDLGSSARDPHKRWALAATPSPLREGPPPREPPPHEAA